jgi:hypothetical protein
MIADLTRVLNAKQLLCVQLICTIVVHRPHVTWERMLGRVVSRWLGPIRGASRGPGPSGLLVHYVVQLALLRLIASSPGVPGGFGGWTVRWGWRSSGMGRFRCRWSWWTFRWLCDRGIRRPAECSDDAQNGSVAKPLALRDGKGSSEGGGPCRTPRNGAL